MPAKVASGTRCVALAPEQSIMQCGTQGLGRAFSAQVNGRWVGNQTTGDVKRLCSPHVDVDTNVKVCPSPQNKQYMYMYCNVYARRAQDALLKLPSVSTSHHRAKTYDAGRTQSIDAALCR